MKKNYFVSYSKIQKKINIYATLKGTKIIKECKISIDNIRKEMDSNKLNIKPPFSKYIEINYKKADKVGMWSWGRERNWNLCSKSAQCINDFYNNYHKKKSWKEIYTEKTHSGQKHRFYKKNQIIIEAQKRLVKIYLDDFEDIFRFRLMKKFRFYGFTVGHVFLAVWHDPDHKIYRE